MKKITLVLLVAVFSTLQVNSQNKYLKHLASFSSKGKGSAETLAYSKTKKRAYLTNSDANSFSIVNIATPASPTLVKEISLASYGAGPNSIDVFGNIVAIAVEANVKQDNGKVLFFDLDGKFLKEVTAGALPDMLTFTPDGKKVLVANEGEPNDRYTVDPEGSVSVIDIATGVKNATVTNIGFTSYNNKKHSLLNKGVRIFGKNATVAQDLEPEYITVTKDGKYAYVNCQENNALVVIDLSKNSIKDIMPLGYKDHSNGTPSVKSYVLNEKVANWPKLGTPVYNGGQPEVKLGGFSGLTYNKKRMSGSTIFYTIPDRGPNDAPVKKAKVTQKPKQNLRPFKLPNYQARIVQFTLNEVTGNITLDKQIMLTRKDGKTPISGRGNIPGADEIPVTYTDAKTPYNKTDYTDAKGNKYHALPYDEFGGDFEGIVIDKRGNFWMCDEYRPALYNFNKDGKLIERYVAKGTSKLGTTEKPAGTYGKETLPAVYSKRRANRGFEAIAYDEKNDIIYTFIQSPMYNPSKATKNKSDIIRILGVKALDGTPVAEYVYVLERNKDKGHALSRVDKIGGADFVGGGRMFVIERDSSKPNDKGGKKYVYSINISFATNVLGKTYTKQLEEMTTDELVAAGIRPVVKFKQFNLPSIGYVSSDKAEGIVFMQGRIAVLNDNDFGLAGAGITDKSVLGIISMDDNYGFDASDKDKKINIKSHQVLGMYQPDAIATYNVNGMDYIVTANEGDARDYTYKEKDKNGKKVERVGYSEETRVGKLKLNPMAYPDAKEIQKKTNLGRLKTTTANGDFDGDGKYEQIYSYGARSFSIFDKYGNLVYDSANIFAKQTAKEEPNLFNQHKGKKDGRSDDKGVEPEAVAIGKIDGKTYAFIGLERQSSLLVFDITNPKDVKFITYYKDNVAKKDIAPEVIRFISAADSPNGKDMILVGYEVSGTMAIIEIDKKVLSINSSEEFSKESFMAYPIPAENILNFNKKVDAVIYSIHGKEVKRINGVNSVNVSNLAEGVYIVKTKKYGSRRFLKM